MSQGLQEGLSQYFQLDKHNPVFYVLVLPLITELPFLTKTVSLSC